MQQSANVFLSPKKRHQYNNNNNNRSNNNFQQRNQQQNYINDVQQENQQQDRNNNIDKDYDNQQGENNVSYRNNKENDKNDQEQYEDVHSKRFVEGLKLEDGMNKSDLFKNDKSDNYKFIFEKPINAKKLDLSDLNIIDIENQQTFHKTPELAHNLEFITQYPGHIFSIDEISKLQKDNGYFLKNIPQADEIDFEAIPPYIPPSKDKLLLNFAKQSNIKYVMSTSTISSVLAQLYYLFSNFRNPSFERISSSFDGEPKKYMISQRKPITNYIRKIDKEKGIYALDGDPGLFKIKNQVLMDLGKIMENQLCLEPETFWNHLKKGENDKDAVLDTDHHRFMKLNNNVCLRSQIDCRSVDQNGDPFVFEIKTRALCPLRYDLMNFTDYLDYDINRRSGLHSSFEREYYDMIRGAFLKYTFQLKIGRMDGAFVAYHNTKEIVGFEYVKTKEIEKRIFGNSIYADTAFVICSKLLTTLVDNILDDLKGEKYEMLKIGYYSCSHYRRMIVFVELFDEQKEWGTEQLMEQTDDIKDEYDYYTKHKPLTNKVYKYEFLVYPYINGVLQKSNNFFLNEHDQVEVEYKFRKIGEAGFLDYMNFLHEAYKFETINLDLNYIGAWVKGY